MPKILQMRQQMMPKMIDFEIKNFSVQDFPINEILERIWVPLRKTYLLTKCIDIVMTFQYVSINNDVVEKDGVKFSFMYSSAFEHLADHRKSSKMYQLLTKRDGVEGDIHDFADDAKKVRVQFISNETFKKWGKEGRMTDRMVREMDAPNPQTITIEMKNAMLDFAAELEQYAKNWNELRKTGGAKIEDPEILLPDD